MLELDHVRKRLGATLALDDCNLRVDAGHRVAIVGANGAGKSTLLKIVAGVLTPDAGAVRWRSQSLSSGRSTLRKKLGYVPESADPPPHLSIAELLHFIAAIKDCQTLGNEELEEFGLCQMLDARIGELSLGQRRRACLAAALTGDPELLILDEPNNGLDRGSLEVLAAMLAKRPACTVLLATHDRAFADLLGARLVSMASGRVTQGV